MRRTRKKFSTLRRVSGPTAGPAVPLIVPSIMGHPVHSLILTKQIGEKSLIIVYYSSIKITPFSHIKHVFRREMDSK